MILSEILTHVKNRNQVQLSQSVPNHVENFRENSILIPDYNRNVVLFISKMQEKFLLPSSTICELINAVNEFQTGSVSLTKQSIVETLKENNVNEKVLNLVLNNPAASN